VPAALPRRRAAGAAATRIARKRGCSDYEQFAHQRSCYAALAMASNFLITWKALTATRRSVTPAPWGSKASSQSGGISPTGRAGHLTGSRSSGALRVCASTYIVKASHLAPLATNGFFGKCQNGHGLGQPNASGGGLPVPDEGLTRRQSAAAPIARRCRAQRFAQSCSPVWVLQAPIRRTQDLRQDRSERFAATAGVLP
jgi:hypothetical protein